MAAVNEMIVREYFEWLGYLVTQPHKYTVPGRAKTAEEQLDLIVWNPLVTEHRIPDPMIWTAGSLRQIACAVIGVRGWHTETFTAGVLEQSPEILRFADKEVAATVSKRLGTANAAKILCLPQLPSSRPLKKKALDVLKARGVDGVLSFRTMLLELIDYVDKRKNYEKSDVLQMIRILKSYDLLKGSQLELFGSKRRRRTKKAKPTSQPGKEPAQ